MASAWWVFVVVGIVLMIAEIFTPGFVIQVVETVHGLSEARAIGLSTGPATTDCGNRSTLVHASRAPVAAALDPLASREGRATGPWL